MWCNAIFQYALTVGNHKKGHVHVAHMHQQEGMYVSPD